jgi:hypothetical protein
VRLEPVAGVDAWLEVARRSPQATFFHTPHWSRIALATGRWEDATLAGRLPDGTEVVYPLLRRRRRALGAYAPVVSGWAGCYGGPIATRGLTSDEAAALHAAVRARVRGELHVTLGPFGPPDQAPRDFEHRADVTHMIDLRDGIDAVIQRYSRGQRHAYNRGLRDGMVPRVGRGEEDVAHYLSMYDDTLARWGERTLTVHPPAVFEELDRVAGEHPQAVRLWLATVGGELAGGAWVFYWNRHAVAWHSAYRNRPGVTVRPDVSFYTEIVRAAAERGDLDWFDLNPSGGQEGTLAFKRRFGAQEHAIEALSCTPAAARAADRALAAGRRLLRR